jgi:tripartite-type tricarboxylate transporter receptor subunit TctC
MNLRKYIAGFVIIFYLALLGYLYFGFGKGKTYPSKPISIIVHSKPGSAIDFMARKVAEIARKHSDVAFVVENRSGTQGLVAMQHVLDMKADGYTLLGVTKSFLSTVMVNKSKVSLDDFQFIAHMVSDPEALIANNERNFHSLDDIIQDADNRETPQVWIGPGTGSRDHLMALKSWEALEINARWIDYKSAPQSILALLRNEASVYVGNPADIKGKNDLDIVSIASSKRLKSLPDVPTFKEQGYDINESMWRGFAFKKGVPDEAVRYVTKVLHDVVNDEEWEDYCDETYVFSDFLEQAEFTKQIKKEIEETNFYLNEAGLLVSYKKAGPNLFLVLLIILTGVFFVILVFSKFKFSDISYDQIIAGSIFSISLFFYYQTSLFLIPDSLHITSPSLIPRIWIVILLLLSVLLYLNSRKEKKVRKHNSPRYVLMIIVLMIAYLFAMQWVGYYLTTPVFILASMYLLQYRKVPFMLINAFGFVIFSYLIFNKLLHIDLPLGWLII